tara:strand:- start:24 stop:467 length:444 start_codon:yes stop_codon:yes gene_type:complete
MARQIRVDQIDDFFEELVVDLVQATTLEWTRRVKKATPVFSLDNYPDLDSLPDFFTLPNGQVVPFRKALLDHGAGGVLRGAWQTKIKKFQGEVTNNLPYAEPVCFGVNLPPSWGGQYRTRQNTVAGFPELIGKELEQYVMQQFRRGI